MTSRRRGNGPKRAIFLRNVFGDLLTRGEENSASFPMAFFARVRALL
jgi:hypothetical protein